MPLGLRLRWVWETDLLGCGFCHCDIGVPHLQVRSGHGLDWDGLIQCESCGDRDETGLWYLEGSGGLHQASLPLRTC